MFVFYIALGPYHNRAGAVYKYQVYKYRKIRIFFGSKNMFFGVSGPLKIRFFSGRFAADHTSLGEFANERECFFIN